MEPLLTANPVTASSREAWKLRRGKWPREHARHEGVERACVVGTTAMDFIRAGHGINPAFEYLSRDRFADAWKDGNQLVSGGEAKHLRDRVARAGERHHAALAVHRP